MATTPGPIPFFYDEQIRRFMLQFARIFTNFQVQFGNDEAGNPVYVTVPVSWGDQSRQAADIIAKNSQNNLPSAPQMTFYISAMKYARDRIQDPTFVGTINVRQRTYDEQTGEYETTQGNAFTIERIMPVPFDLTMTLDIWTSNQQQKQQLLEQILTLFNPSVEIQGSDNYIDWTSITVLELEDVTYSGRSIPISTGNPIDIATLTFKLPIWISPPVKVKKLGVIQKIIANIYDAAGDVNNAISDNDLLLGTRMAVTYQGYQILLLNGQVQCLLQNTPHNPPNSSTDADSAVASSSLIWPNVIAPYGVMVNGISQIRLQNPYLDTEIVGTISQNPLDDRFLLFDVDPQTLPTNTLNPVTAVINPQRSGPGAGLPQATAGTRYLLTANTGHVPDEYKDYSANVEYYIGATVKYNNQFYSCYYDNNGLGIIGQPPTNSTYWQNVWPFSNSWTNNGVALVANANDVIQYDGSVWYVDFNSRAATETQFLTNLTTSVQYRYDPTEQMWVKSYEGYYNGGEWSLVL
jgi:hypothetical protein